MRKMSKTKRFFKRVEKFFSYFKQRYIVWFLLYRSGAKELVRQYANRNHEACGSIGAESPIWVCWWQGEEAMPDIAKACLRSIRRYACAHPVRLITAENFSEYVTFPPEIMEKQRRGLIDLTHFSDILRVSLLARYGGIWMDATVLIPSRPLDEFIRPTETFWSCHHKPIYHNISRGGWVSFFWACGKDNLLPAFMADFHIRYWLRHDKLIVYLLLDYAFALARKYIPAVHRMIEEVPLSAMGPLGKCLNDEYRPEEWEHFCRDYDFHKLTYKIPLHRTTPDGKETYYGHILAEYLEAVES